MSRKLASLRRVSEINSIENADNIVVATVDGWKVVTGKDNFVPGDVCVFFEVDSFLPVDERFEFLRKSCFKSTTNLGDGFRLRTVKLRGQISQGLILPVSEFPEIPGDLAVGDDLTDILRVQKYESPGQVNQSGDAKGRFPHFIPKTDQERAQNLLRDIGRHSLDTFEITMKLDGSSMTVYQHGEEGAGVCSRNLDLSMDENNVFWQTAIKSGALNHLADIYKNTGRSYAIQGELMGPGVQGNREGLQRHEFYVFDVYDIDNQVYLNAFERDLFLKNTGLLSVPLVEYRSNIPTTIDELLEIAEGKSINHPIREGVVFKSVDNHFTFKVISNTFLLKEK